MRAEQQESAETGEKYAFIATAGKVYAVAAPDGQDQIVIGGILFRAREPETADEIQAVWASKKGRGLIMDSEDAFATPSCDAVAAMAGVIITAARDRGVVTKDDFLQAGVPDASIASLRDEAFTIARQLEPRVAAMLVDGVGAPA